MRHATRELYFCGAPLSFFLNDVLTLQAVIDGPSTGVERQPLRYRDMTLTSFVIKVPFGAGTPAVKKAFDASGVADKWAASKWAKTIKARETRKHTTDCMYHSRTCY